MEEYELCRDGKPLRGTVVKLKIEPTFLSQTLPLRDAHRNCNYTDIKDHNDQFFCDCT